MPGMERVKNWTDRVVCIKIRGKESQQLSNKKPDILAGRFCTFIRVNYLLNFSSNPFSSNRFSLLLLDSDFAFVSAKNLFSECSGPMPLMFTFIFVGGLFFTVLLITGSMICIENFPA